MFMKPPHTDIKPPYICTLPFPTLLYVDCLKHFCIKLICVLYKILLREVYSTGTIHENISC